jgi:hypothetical protein
MSEQMGSEIEPSVSTTLGCGGEGPFAARKGVARHRQTVIFHDKFASEPSASAGSHANNGPRHGRIARDSDLGQPTTCVG